jgi:hypothetical protein
MFVVCILAIGKQLLAEMRNLHECEAGIDSIRGKRRVSYEIDINGVSMEFWNLKK